MCTDEFKLAKSFVMKGQGVSLFPFKFISDEIKMGVVTEINLDGWHPENITHYLLYAHFNKIPIKTRELVSFLTKDGLMML